MKKALALTVIATASGAAVAQESNVTVYGILDAGVSHVTGIAGGSRNDVISGIMDGSRLGFRGNEDIGNGFRAIFTLEHRLEVDTGDVTNRPFSGSQLPDRLNDATLLGLPALLIPAPVNLPSQVVVDSVATILGNSLGVNLGRTFWDRQAYVGLITPVGAVLAGRQYTPAYEVGAAFDTLGTQSSLSAGQVAAVPASFDIRINNALAYRIQTGPISASLMYAPDEGSTTTGRLFGAMGIYRTEAFAVGLGYNTRKNEAGQDSLTSTVVGGSMQLGPGTAFVQVTQAKDDNPTGTSGLAATIQGGLVGQGVPAQFAAPAAATVANAFIEALKQDSQLAHIGYKYVTGPHTIYGAYTALNDKRPNNADVASYGAAYTYALSKRTALNAVLTHFDNKNLAQAAPGQAGFLGGVTEEAGTDSNSLAVGIRHSF
jgi:predicted porin